MRGPTFQVKYTIRMKIWGHPLNNPQTIFSLFLRICHCSSVGSGTQLVSGFFFVVFLTLFQGLFLYWQNSRTKSFIEMFGGLYKSCQNDFYFIVYKKMIFLMNSQLWTNSKSKLAVFWKRTSTWINKSRTWGRTRFWNT